MILYSVILYLSTYRIHSLSIYILYQARLFVVDSRISPFNFMNNWKLVHKSFSTYLILHLDTLVRSGLPHHIWNKLYFLNKNWKNNSISTKPFSHYHPFKVYIQVITISFHIFLFLELNWDIIHCLITCINQLANQTVCFLFRLMK